MKVKASAEGASSSSGAQARNVDGGLVSNQSSVGELRVA
jgi:hypothetical protein